MRGCGGKSVRAARLCGATALATLFALAVLPPLKAPAQSIGIGQDIPADAQMLLEADTLVYDNDQQTITAVGGVRIEYGGNRLVAQRVTYNRRTARLIASGNVEIIDRDGTKFYSDQIDVTDDFRDGFVNTLRVETTDRTYFGAQSAERAGGRLTTFYNGVYTACEPCEEKPDKPPIWRVKARKIIWNGQAKTVRFEQPRFEFFGFPIAYLPAFEIADPTVKRKTGFLMPGIGYNDELGFSLSVPFYIALSPTYDLTLTGTGYTNQGFLAEAEWRQRFNNGQYNLKVAGIHQLEPEAFDANTVDREKTNRGMIGSKGEFKINPRWTFGWDVLLQSDKNFSHRYGIGGFDQYHRRNEVYLTGLNERNYFDLRFMKFQVQEGVLDTIQSGINVGRLSPSARDPIQPWVLPSFDYAYTPDEPVFGGELNIDVNAQNIYRSELDRSPANLLPLEPPPTKVGGVGGATGRITAEAEWKRTYVTDIGLAVTPLLHARGDAIYADVSEASAGAIAGMAGAISGAQYSHDGSTYGTVGTDLSSAYFRSMATAGMEVRWPILFANESSSHVLEPTAQLLVRPDAPYQSELGIPNEDAQSMVFDATTLFERDKFSGYDRIEGGTRANLGIRYSGSFGSGWTTNGLFGQSFHLAGENPYAQPDLVNAGAYSGLETDRSDYVGLVGLTSPGGVAVSAGARFDEENWDVRRAELKAGYSGLPVSLTGRYTFIEGQPLYGYSKDRHEVTLAGTARLHEYWKTFGSGTYDLASDTLVRRSFGFAYDDECFTFMLTYSDKRAPDATTWDRSIGFQISFRTLGDFGTSTGALDGFTP